MRAKLLSAPGRSINTASTEIAAAATTCVEIYPRAPRLDTSAVTTTSPVRLLPKRRSPRDRAGVHTDEFLPFRYHSFARCLRAGRPFSSNAGA